MTLPVCANPAPYSLDVKKDEKYCWCTCGLSAQQPLCDGAHKGTGMKSLHWIAEKDETVWFCGCKRTKTPPFCDGSHNELQAAESISERE